MMPCKEAIFRGRLDGDLVLGFFEALVVVRLLPGSGWIAGVELARISSGG